MAGGNVIRAATFRLGRMKLKLEGFAAMSELSRRLVDGGCFCGIEDAEGISATSLSRDAGRGGRTGSGSE
jgi:hypothetical protein